MSGSFHGAQRGAMGSVAAAVVGYAAWNPLDAAADITVSGDDDEIAVKDSGSDAWVSLRADLAKSGGKLYAEFVCDMALAPADNMIVGVAGSAASLATHIGAAADGWCYFSVNGRKIHAGTATPWGGVWDTGIFVIGMAWDADLGKLWWSIDNVWQAGGDPAAGTGEAFSGVTGTLFLAASFFNNIAGQTCTLVTNPTDQTYSPPGDFTDEWSNAALLTAVCVGDSLTEGNHVAVTDPYPDQLPDLLGAGWSSVNLGEGGARVADCQANWTAYSGDEDAVIVACGYNNIAGDGESSATVWAALEPLFDDIRGSATHLIVGTMNPFKGNAAKWTAQKQTDADALTALIEAYATTHGLAVFDMAAFLEDDITADYLEADYDTGDGTHPNQDGTDRMAQEATTLIGTLSFP